MPAIVCRDRALAEVTGALERPPALVLIEGEAGIGKTRLVQECLWAGRWQGGNVLMVECQQVAKPMPLEPVVNGLRRLRDETGGVQLSPLGGALRPLFPDWDADLPPPLEPLPEPGARRHRVYRALGELVDRLGVELLVIEDAHWADSASLEWLSLARDGWGDRRSVLVTFRPRTVPPLPPQLRRLGSRMPVGMGKVRIVLRPLDVAGIQQLTAAMFRTQVSREFAEFLHERTGGLPLAVEECLKLLRDRGDIMRKDGGWGRKELTQMREVPPNLRDSVLERVERLAPRTRQVLEAAAVLGEAASDRLLAKVAGLDVPTTRSGVATGFRAGLLRGAGRGLVAFRHQLAADAVAAEIPEFKLARLHRRAAEALRTGDQAPVARLSHHYREAGDVEAWARYAEASADLALESGDDYAAVTLLYDLLTSVEHPAERRARLARKLGETAVDGTASLADRAGPVTQALRRVLAGGDIPRGERGAIRLLLGLLLRWYGLPEAADREIEAAIEDLGDRLELACRAMMNLGSALARDWPVRQHLEWIERASALVPRVEATAERRHLAAIRVSALLALGEQDGWRAAAELPQAGSSPSEQRTSLLSTIDIGRLSIIWGRYAEARTLLDEGARSTLATGYQRVANPARTARAYLDWYTGRWASLAESLAQLTEIDTTERTGIRNEIREITGLLALAAGTIEAAEQQLAETLNAYRCDGPLNYRAAVTAAGLGRLRLAEGAPDEALRVTEPVTAWIANKELWLWATDVIWVHIDALTGTGQLTQADELAGRFAGWQSGRHAPAPVAASQLCQGILAQAHGDLDKAAQLYAEAAGAWAALPRPYDELLALERQGRCLLAAEGTDQALEILSEAQKGLQNLGAQWDADRVARLLRQQEATIGRRGPGRDPDRLSPRELTVIALVAQGMTNREAGQVMFLSPKTIEYYLRNAMRKLGASTRTGAAMAAAKAGLIPSASGEQVGASASR